MFIVNSIVKFYTHMSLFTKLIIPSLLSIILVSSYILLIYYETSLISNNTQIFQEKYIPILERSKKNQVMLKQIVETFTFCASSGDSEWLDTTQKYKYEIQSNLEWINNNTPSSKLNTKKIQEQFEDYFKVTYIMTKQLVEYKNTMDDDKQIEHVFTAYKKINSSLLAFHLLIKKLANDESEKVIEKASFILSYSIFFALLLYISLFFVSFLIYQSIYKRFLLLIESITNTNAYKGVVKEKLEAFSNDEFGMLSSEFRNVIDGFEEKYEKLELEKEGIEEMAKRDKLTDLYNRHQLDYILDKLEDGDTDYGIIILDIDFFKLVNDNYGHQIGDDVLVHVAKILQENSRESDVLGRWGGEEFILITHNTDYNTVLSIAEKFRTVIKKEYFNKVGNITVSLGIAISNTGLSSSQVIKLADNALYKAKDSGRDKVCA